MKTKSITCWICKRAMYYWADAQDRLPFWIRNHIAKCVSCEQTMRQLSLMLEKLQTTAHAMSQPAPDFLAPRIFARTQASPRNEHRCEFNPSLAIVSAIVLVFLTGVSLTLQTRWKSGGPIETAISHSPLIQSPRLLLLPISQADGHSLLEWGEKLEQPLQQELAFVMNDAKNAANALADSFIPVRIRKAWSSMQKEPSDSVLVPR